MLRKMLDRMYPMFAPGGKYERLYPLYEAQDTFLYSTGETAPGPTHIRDALDTKRMMSMVIVALIPCILMALYNTGYQTARIIEQVQAHDSAWQMAGWRYWLLGAIGINFAEAGDFYQNFLNPRLLVVHMIHGATYFLPVYIVCLASGGVCELIFALVRRHEINEGFLVTSMLLPLVLPPTIPWWQVAMGTVFGVVIGKEIFGGTGRNFLNPALTGRAFLYFAYPAEITGDDVWMGADQFVHPSIVDAETGQLQVHAFSGATPLGALEAAEDERHVELLAGLSGRLADVPVQAGEVTWWDAFFGNIHGSMGETSALACLIGAAILIATRIGSWRIMVATTLGMVAFSGLINLLQIRDPLYELTPWWHFVLGGFAFGVVFMATDPVSASMTNTGKWIYGLLIGFITIVIRVLNPAFPEGIMMAILFANVFAPLIDWFVVQANIKRRLARNAA